MAIRAELSLRLQNSPGSLSRVCNVLAGERVNLVALCLDGSGTLRMVVDNYIHAAATLRGHYQVENARSDSVMPNQPGSLASGKWCRTRVGNRLRYATVSDRHLMFGSSSACRYRSSTRPRNIEEKKTEAKVRIQSLVFICSS